jgi:MinD superfamily P-loop ATPase
LGTTDHFGVASLVATNKADLNRNRSEEITASYVEQGVEVVGRIPYDTVVTEAMVQGWPVTEHSDGPVTEALKGVWWWIKNRLFVDQTDSETGAWQR